jgi:hypothetical protein
MTFGAMFAYCLLYFSPDYPSMFAWDYSPNVSQNAADKDVFFARGHRAKTVSAKVIAAARQAFEKHGLNDGSGVLDRTEIGQVLDASRLTACSV